MTKHPRTSFTQFLKDRAMRRGIMVSVVASLLVLLFIQPLVRLLWRIVLFISASFYSGYVDSLYRGASLGHRNHVDVSLLFYAVFGVAILLWTVVLVLRALFRHAIETGVEDDADDNNDKPEVRRIRVIKRGRRLLATLYICLTVFSLLVAGRVFRAVIDLELNTSFQRNLNVLAPEIDEDEEERFTADWATMSSRSDYLVLTGRMEQRAEELGVTLPPSLLP